jgi:DNA polymerase III subunit delta'
MKMNDPNSEIGPPLPIANPDLFDQNKAEAIFLDAYNSGRIPHAWLLSGGAGIGKATLAFRIARFILSSQNSPEDYSNLAVDTTDAISRRIISGGHADFLCIQRSIDEKTNKKRKEITVNEVRGVTSFLSRTPAEGGWRVIVVDSADEMNSNAANAILKILEEPPKRAIILLVSNNPSKLLPTIRSRCRRLPLNPLRANTIHKTLQQYYPQITPEDLIQLVDIADGSLGRAIELAQDGGLDIYREVSSILDTLPQLDIPRLHQLGDKLSRVKSDQVFRRTFDIINRWLSIIIKDLALNKKSNLDTWIDMWENTNRLVNHTRGLNLDPKQAILNTFLAIKNSTNHLGPKL